MRRRHPHRGQPGARRRRHRQLFDHQHVHPAEPAHLTLTKIVDNTGGGTAAATDWTLSATGPDTISGASGDPAITAAAVGAGTYTLAETGGPTGYTPGDSAPTGNLTGASLVLAAGDTVSCSITNTLSPPRPPT